MFSRQNEVMHPQMSTERLREYLFGSPKAKFWDYDPDKLTLGIEVEYFIGKTNSDGFQLAKRPEYLSVVSELVSHHGYFDRGLRDQPGRISRDVDSGFIVIKPDFAWHILEVSLPPCKSLDELESLLTNVLCSVDAALGKFGLKRLDLSCLSDPPPSIDLVNLDRLEQISETFKPKRVDRPTQDPEFPAYVAATHVHLNVSNEEVLTCFPALYHLDKVISERFNRGRTFRGRTYENVRTALYRDTLGHDYLLHTYPIEPATNLNELCDQMNRSPKLFLRDGFFPVRDMSYIRPTRYGTLEFRSACSFNNVDKIIEIVKWRRAQIIAATGVHPVISTPELEFLRSYMQKASA
jgi:hypothetical protein